MFRNSVIPSTLSGPSAIIYCHDLAYGWGYTFFSLNNGNICAFAGANIKFDRFGPSNDCKLPCGNESTPSGAICGGYNANSVYQIEVHKRIYHNNKKTEPPHPYAYPQYSHLGCFQAATGVIQSSVVLLKQRVGLDTIANCHYFAGLSGSQYFALQNGTICNYGNSTSNLTKKTSSSCNSSCGTTSSSKGLHCGGINSNSVYAIGVRFELI